LTASEAEIFQEVSYRQGSRFHDVVHAAQRNPAGVLLCLICLMMIVMALVGPYIAPHSATAIDGPFLEAPSWSYPFGTDNLFRDQFSRVLIGARISLGIGFGSVVISTAIGVFLGLTSGFLGGWWDMVVSRIIDLMIAFPPVVFLIFFLTILPPDFWTVCISIGLVLAPGTTRVVRSATIAVRNLQFIEAAVSTGCSPMRIMVHHILPNVTAAIIVMASVQIGTAILAEATISFLGLGVTDAAHPSWGRMLQESRQLWREAWWVAVIPGLALSLAVLSFNLFGDALRDALDPRLRGSR
jgi:peptide/nickel transport system permease protein